MSSGHFGYSTQPRPLHEPLETPPGFGSAPVFWRFSYGREPNESASGLAQSKTLPRDPRVHGSDAHEVVGALREPHFLPRGRGRGREGRRSIGLISRTRTSTTTNWVHGLDARQGGEIFPGTERSLSFDKWIESASV